MAEVIVMPKLSDTMKEGVLAKWLKKVGDKVQSGDIIAEVGTDKATMDMESFQEGTLLYLGAKEGEAVAINAVIAILGEEGEDYQALLNTASAPAASAPVAEAAPAAKSSCSSAPASSCSSSNSGDDRLKISPLAKVIAKEHSIDVKTIKGSAEGGRIVKKDIENAIANKNVSTPAAAAVAAAPGLDYEDIAVTPMRKVIATRLSESLYTAPHFYLTMSIDMDKAIETRKMLNGLSDVKVSFNDLVLKAVAVALKKHPKINSSWQGDVIRLYKSVNIGVAVSVDNGLLVPVIRNADTKSLSSISSEVKEFASKAKDNKLVPADWAGSTFTISNLGMFGVEQFNPIINSPDSCILGVGGISQVPVVKDGQVVPGNVMKVTLACDHRVVDGSLGAEFLQTLKSLIENPMRLML